MSLESLMLIAQTKNLTPLHLEQSLKEKIIPIVNVDGTKRSTISSIVEIRGNTLKFESELNNSDTPNID
jgi:hypothetical protein